MKMILNKSYFSLLAIVLFCGCLKTNDLYEGFNDLAPIADLPLSHLSTDTLTIYAVNVAASADATTDTVVAVHLSAKNHVGAVTFRLGVGANDSAFTAYLAAHPEYTLMPPNLYSFDSTVTIQDAGVLNTANFAVRFKTAAVDADGNNLFLSNNYLLPIIIRDAGGYQIASNFRMIVMSVLAKNQYDGLYELTQKTTGWAAYGIADGDTYTWPSDVSLASSGGTSVDLSTDETGVLQPAFTASGGITGFGATQPRYIFDGSNKLVSVINLAPDDGRGRTFFLNTAVPDSRYDPATKTVYAAYVMTQLTRPNQFFYDTLKYVGPR